MAAGSRKKLEHSIGRPSDHLKMWFMERFRKIRLPGVKHEVIVIAHQAFDGVLCSDFECAVQQSPGFSSINLVGTLIVKQVFLKFL